MNKCRVCFKPIKKFMSFGKMPIANSFIKKDKFKKQYFYDMEAGFCKNCSALISFLRFFLTDCKLT